MLVTVDNLVRLMSISHISLLLILVLSVQKYFGQLYSYVFEQSIELDGDQLRRPAVMRDPN